MDSNHFDVIVIGTGPGGEGAAMQAAKEGKRVAVIEKYSHIGGGCTHYGTIPSKALRFSIFSMMEALNNPIMKAVGIHPSPTLEQLRSSSQSGKQIKTDILLWANGRSGNSEDLELQNIGVTPNARGLLKVNAQFQTEVEHVYAVGDIVGYPSLASAAYMQGRAAALHLMGCTDRCLTLEDIPTGIYTSPEISSVGRTERELTAEKIPYEVGHSQFKSLARAQITGRTVGMLKLLFHRETREILGVHCFGANAAEIVHIGQAIMKQPPPNNSLDYFINTTFNYPTMAEAYRVAALNGYNRLF